MEINIQPLDKIAEAAKDFLQKVITPPLEELGLLAADRIKLWRFKNQIEILLKAEKTLKQKGLKTRKVSLKVLTPLIEESSLEDDESLQQKWANLIANTVCEGSSLNTTLYAHILSQLTKDDAELFELLAGVATSTHKFEQISVTVNEKRVIVIKELRKSRNNFELQLDNLLRLRLVKEIQTYNMDSNLIVLTDLGFRFLNAVSEV